MQTPALMLNHFGGVRPMVLDDTIIQRLKGYAIS